MLSVVPIYEHRLSTSPSSGLGLIEWVIVEIKCSFMYFKQENKTIALHSAQPELLL